jgi:hypothetical protein
MLFGWLGLWLFGMLSAVAFLGVMASKIRDGGEERHAHIRRVMLSLAAACDLGGAALAGALIGTHWLPAAAFGFLFCGTKIATAYAVTDWYNRFEAKAVAPDTEAETLRRRNAALARRGDSSAALLLWATLGLIDLILLVFGVTCLAYLAHYRHLI